MNFKKVALPSEADIKELSGIINDDFSTKDPDFHYNKYGSIYYADNVLMPKHLLNKGSPCKKFNLSLQEQIDFRCGDKVISSTDQEFLEWFNKKRELFNEKRKLCTK